MINEQMKFCYSATEAVISNLTADDLLLEVCKKHLLYISLKMHTFTIKIVLNHNLSIIPKQYNQL